MLRVAGRADGLGIAVDGSTRVPVRVSFCCLGRVGGCHKGIVSRDPPAAIRAMESICRDGQ